MSSIIYNKAFQLQLSHGFYTDAHKYNVNRQLNVFATAATSELVRNGRMRMVRTEMGLNVFYQAYRDSSMAVPEVKPLVPLTGEIKLVFGLVINPSDTSFLNTTNLDQGGTYRSGNIFFLDGTMPAGPTPDPEIPLDLTLTPSLIGQLRPSVFTYSFLPDDVGIVADLEVNVFAEGAVTPLITIDAVPVDPATGSYSVQIDLSKEPAGIYTITANDSGTPQHSGSVYADSELAVQNVFGIVRVTYPDPDYFYKGLPDIADYTFEARAVQWRYYAAIKSVPQNFFDNHRLQIIDYTNPDPPVYTFTALNGGGIPNNTIKINGSPTVIFTSDDPIPFSETAISRFKLMQIKLDEDEEPVPPDKQLMSALPNAAVSGVDSNQVGVPDENFAEIFLFLDQVSDP